MDYDDGVNYSVLSVAKRRSSLVFLCGIHGYSISKQRNGITSLKCYFRPGGCEALATICNGYLEPSKKKNIHTCNQTDTYWKQNLAKNEMREKASACAEALSNVHQSVLGSFDDSVASDIPFVRIKSSLKKARTRRYLPCSVS